ncbi:DUF3857 domain-containing protein [Mucilaginibacter ginsenosidivorans]|uniref:DUF3857 domain-containing protein n=1 Tax=Mucilaginibacter ginsenosidivorans TaxID=398053 RepID=A0A5B8UVY2_9SPHI|nr:DUF3857 domain-containing protein [Mucilaginibacter ginsenosidivorans]QEC62596.1 DUF3857 domain-containing protein [Mucilaginibacter ginsenosidivorans]
MITFLNLKKTFFLSILILAGSAVSAQDIMSKAWDAFFENRRADAKELFMQAAKQPGATGNALLGLSILSHGDGPALQSFNYFKQFYAQSKNPQPYVYALWNTPSINETFGKKTPEQLAFLRELATNKNYDGTIAAIAYSMLGKHYETSKKTEQANKEYANIGSVDSWAISGEFENISSSGFDKSYETLNHPEDTSAFKNKKGVKVAWHSVPYLRHDKWFDFTYYANAYNSIMFAQTFVKSDTETEVQLRIGVSGSLKVWVNDQQIISEPEERNNDLDTYIQSMKLHKGYNRILVQIGESYAERSNFLLRITDEKGDVVPNLMSTYKAQPYTRETNYTSHKIEQFAVAYFDQQIKKDANDNLSKLLLTQIYLREDKTFEARRLIEPLLKKYPNSTYLNSLLLEVFSKTNNRTGAETVKERIKMADPESSLSLTLKYQELLEQKNYDKAASVIDKLEVNYPFQREFIYLAKMNLAGYNKNQDELIKATEEAYNKFPDNQSFVYIKYLIETNLRKNTAAALEVLKKYVDNNDNYTYAKLLAGTYFTAGNSTAGLKVYQDEIYNDPIGVAIYEDLAEQYYKLQMYDKAADSYLDCIRIAPTRASYYTSLGKIYEANNQKDKSIQYYQKSLELDPSNYESIKSLRKLQNKKDVYSYFEEPDIDAIIKNAPAATDYPDDNFVMLDKETQRIVYENGGSEDKNFLVAKILTQKGIESWKQYDIDTDNGQDLTVETAEVIKANGNKIPAERNDGSLVFTNLEVGDVVNIRYKTENYFKGRLASHFWDTFYFTMGYPCVNSKYSLLISKNKKFSYKFSRQVIEPQKTSADEFDMYVWKDSKSKSLEYEDKMPALDDVANILYLTSIPDWKFVSDWYNDLASAKARKNYEVTEVVRDMFDGKANLTDMQKVEKIYDYITNNISYSSVSFRQSGWIPQNPADVINTRIGDCKDVSTLFVTMCKEAGIKAQLVLVKTRDNGLNKMVVPAIDFNHCIAKVELNARDYYIELTSQYLPFRCIYTTELNSALLDIGDDNTTNTIKYLNPATRKQNNIHRSVSIILKDRDFLINENTYKTASLAGGIREAYNELSSKDQVKKIKEAIAVEYPDNEITGLSFSNMAKNSGDTVYMKLDYQLKNITKVIAGMSVFSLPWSDKFTPSDIQIILPRATGLDLSQMYEMDNETETITVTVPAGKKIIEGLIPIKISNDILDYSIVSKMIGNKLILTRTFKLKKDFIPAEKSAEFNNIFKKMVEADNKEFAMR